MTTGERFERAVAIMHRLRAPGGCPWDREQTFDTIKQYTLEETYEVIEAIENRDWPELTGELGDLLLQVLFYAEMSKEEGRFGIDEVLETLSDKLVRRHPHVFGDVEANTSGEVLKNWEQIKQQEKKAKPEKKKDESLLSSVSSAMPALMEGLKLSNKAAHVGFDWPNVEGVFDKLQEEVGELKEEVAKIPPPGPVPVGRGVAGARGAEVPEQLQQRLHDEIGDMLFVLVNLARYLNVDPESALRATNRKFRRRFEHVEKKLREAGKKFEESDIDEMEQYWQDAKGKS